MVSKEGTITEKKTRSKRFQYNIIFCPYCGAAVDHNLLIVQDSICIDCKNDMTDIISTSRMNKQTKRYCMNCSYENPFGVVHCIKCGTNDFREKKKRFRSKYFHKRETIVGVISILIAVGISCGIVFGFATEYIIAQRIVGVIIVISFSLVLTAFLYVIIMTIVKAISEGH